MVNSELKKKNKGFGGKWVWVVIPLIAAIVAISISSKTCSKISLFGVIGKACQCAMVYSISHFTLLSDPCMHTYMFLSFAEL